MRIILFTGKGGVGKTTIAAATGAYASTLNKKVLIISVDPAHSLSDVLEVELEAEPKEVQKNFFAQEVDVYYSVEKFWGELKDYIRALFQWKGVDEILAEELSVLPGMEEVSSFLWINKHLKDGIYDVIILDAAPTGETLRFLSIPDVAKWWIDKILPIQKKIVKVVRPAVKAITDFPLPEDETYDAAENLFNDLFFLYKTLQNPEISSIRLVTNPEKMVMRETERAFTYLHLYGYPVDAVILNRVVDENNFLYEIQKNYLERIKTSFEPLPLFKVPYYDKEILGFDSLVKLGEEIYGSEDPLKVFYRDSPFEILSMDGKYVLKLYFKNLKKEKASVFQRGEDLVIRIGNQKRHFYLPRVLTSKIAREAIIRDNSLDVIFE
ncbi:MAG: TRC40/GET3/ArsA family transport-energizing ATPase [candidate division WOR-3 bacterium]